MSVCAIQAAATVAIVIPIVNIVTMYFICKVLQHAADIENEDERRAP